MNDTRNAVEEINLEKVRTVAIMFATIAALALFMWDSSLIFIPSFPLSLLGALIRRTGLMAEHA